MDTNKRERNNCRPNYLQATRRQIISILITTIIFILFFNLSLFASTRPTASAIPLRDLQPSAYTVNPVTTDLQSWLPMELGLLYNYGELVTHRLVDDNIWYDRDNVIPEIMSFKPVSGTMLEIGELGFFGQAETKEVSIFNVAKTYTPLSFEDQIVPYTLNIPTGSNNEERIIEKDSSNRNDVGIISTSSINSALLSRALRLQDLGIMGKVLVLYGTSENFEITNLKSYRNVVAGTAKPVTETELEKMQSGLSMRDSAVQGGKEFKAFKNVAGPIPVDGATNVPIDQQLRWLSAGATSYDVYFGTSNPPVYKTNQVGTSYNPNPPGYTANQAGITYNPGQLAYSTTYYWRIDSKNSVRTTRGDVWSFTTAPYLPPVNGAINVLSGKLRIDFDLRNGTGLSSVKFDANGDNMWSANEEVMFRNDYDFAESLSGSEGLNIPRIYTDIPCSDGKVFAVSDHLRGALRTYTTYFIPNNLSDIFFIRMKVSALGDCIPRWPTRLCFELNPVFNNAYVLPTRQLLNPPTNEYSGQYMGSYPSTGQGFEIVGNNITMDYLILEQDYKNPVSTNDSQWYFQMMYQPLSLYFGSLTPLFNKLGNMKQGDELYITFALRFYNIPAPVDRPMFGSNNFEIMKQSAIKWLDAGETALKQIEEKWLYDIGTYSFYSELISLKVDMDQLQRLYWEVDNKVLDGEVRAEIAGVPANSERTIFTGYSSEYLNISDKYDELLNSCNELGALYAIELNNNPIIAINQVKTELNSLKGQIQNYSNVLQAFKSQIASWQPAQEFSLPTPSGNTIVNKLFFNTSLDQPSTTGSDSWIEELKKMKSFGIDYVEIYLGDYRLVYDYVISRNWTYIIDKWLTDCRNAGIKAFLYFSYDYGPPDGQVPDYYSPNKTTCVDYNNPAAVSYDENIFKIFAQEMYTKFSDVVAGFTCNNERSFYSSPSKYGKDAFYNYIVNKYSSSISWINSAWAQNFSSWSDVQAYINGTDLDNVPLPGAGADWMIFSKKSWAHNYYGTLYRGIQQGWPGIDIMAKDPYSVREWVAEEGFISGSNWDWPNEQPNVLDAYGKFVCSEFWWARWWNIEKMKKNVDSNAESWYGVFQNGEYPSKRAEDSIVLTATSKLWRRFIAGTRGFTFYTWGNRVEDGKEGQCLNILDLRKGILRAPAARITPVMDKMRNLDNLIQNTKIFPQLAVLLSVTENALIGQPETAYEAPSALANANVSFKMICEKDILNGSLSAYSHLVIPGKYYLPHNVSEQVTQWVANGGTLILMGASGVRGAEGYLDYALETASGVRFNVPTPDSIKEPSNINFPEIALNVPIPTELINGLPWGPDRVFRDFTLNENPANYTVLATYQDGLPAVVKHSYGNGKVITSGAVFLVLPWTWEQVINYTTGGWSKTDTDKITVHSTLTQSIDYILNKAGIEKIVEINRLGGFSYNTENVSVFVRQPLNTQSPLYIFLINTGHKAIGGKVSELLEGNDIYENIQINTPVTSITEIIRNVPVLFSTVNGKAVINNFKLRSGVLYIFKVQ